jgi:hypothetical protein
MIQYYVFKYRDFDTKNPGALSMNAGMFAGMNPGSRCHPYPTKHFKEAKFWEKLDEVEVYQKMFPELKAYRVKITMELI